MKKKEKQKPKSESAESRRDLVPEITAEFGIRLTQDSGGVIYLEIEPRCGGDVVEFPFESRGDGVGLYLAATALESVLSRNFPNLIAELFGALYWKAQYQQDDPRKPLDKKSKKKAEKELVAKMKRLETTFKAIMIPPRWKQNGKPKTVGSETVTNYIPVSRGRDPDSSEKREPEKAQLEGDVEKALRTIDANSQWDRTLLKVGELILIERNQINKYRNHQSWLVNQFAKHGIKWREWKTRKF